MKNYILICALLAASCSLLADQPVDLSKIDTSKLAPPAAKKDLTFVRDIKPLVQNSCGKCHGPEKPKGKFRVDSREFLLKGGESKTPVVVPGQSAKSALVLFASDLVEEMEMPPKDKRTKFPALNPEQIGILRAWIDQGAK